jgi:hypothetical protein
MRTILALAMIAVLGGFGVALANDQGRNDERAAQARAISADDMKAKADKLGYDVEHLKKDDDHYHAHLIDRETGAGVEAAFDKKTGELVSAQLAREDRETGERDESREHKDEHRESGEHQEQDRD